MLARDSRELYNAMPAEKLVDDILKAKADCIISALGIFTAGVIKQGAQRHLL